MATLHRVSRLCTRRLAVLSPHIGGFRATRATSIPRPLALPALSWRHSHFHTSSGVLAQLDKTSRNVRKSTENLHRAAEELNAEPAESAQSQSQNAQPENAQPAQPEKGEDKPRWKRPTKEEMLSTATGFYNRMRVRFKWALFRQDRPTNMDDISAFLSWFMVGNIVWIVLGTTTFFSLVLFTMNTVFAQEWIAAKIGNIVSRQTGMSVVFEEAIVPHWKGGVIQFRNVFVSRRPGGGHKARKGSQGEAAALAGEKQHSSQPAQDDDGNYTQFDLTIETVDVTLSFSKYMSGKGILKEVEVKGIRGVVDRNHLRWKRNQDPRKNKNVHKTGDFEIENFKLEDALVSLHQPGRDRPFNVSVFNMELPQLRKHWLFYDLLSANNLSGSYDNSLFTIHPRQIHGVPSSQLNEDKTWKKVSRLRVDKVNIEHLNRGVQGAFGWIVSGNVDLLADLMLPSDTDDYTMSEMMKDVLERWEHTLMRRGRKPGDPVSMPSGSHSDEPLTTSAQAAQAQKYLVLDLRVQLNDVRAAVPLFNTDLNYVNNAMIRPIVAYINSRDTYIPINCRVVKKVDDFAGSWTMYDSGLMDNISEEVYQAFAENVSNDEARHRRMKKVSLWSLQLAAQLLLLSIGTIA
ncbi:Mitochondrial distribution and morphology protein 31 [Yarrowia sp. B02]|nr:Mitochondrial distribution and morphology protein 31 [Yarrowia sp. B02]